MSMFYCRFCANLRDADDGCQDVGGGLACMDCMDDGDDECPTCNGRGTVNPLTAPADFFCVGTTTCPRCDGSGEWR